MRDLLADQRVDPQSREIDGEQQRAERKQPHAPSARAITICWISSVPSPIVRIFASR